VLLITRDAPCELLDRLRELSGEGRTGVLPCFIDAALRDASALPGASSTSRRGAGAGRHPMSDV
jgi:hypothetical protein